VFLTLELGCVSLFIVVCMCCVFYFPHRILLCVPKESVGVCRWVEVTNHWVDRASNQTNLSDYAKHGVFVACTHGGM